jgi:hypothetical protein
MNRFKSQPYYFHVLKDTKQQARCTLLTSASDELIEVIECAINAVKGITNYLKSKRVNSTDIWAGYVRWSTQKSVLKASVHFKFKEVDLDFFCYYVVRCNSSFNE